MSACFRSIWKCCFLRRGENRDTQRKTSQRKGENQQQTQPNMWRWSGDLNPGHFGERRVLLPLCHPCSHRNPDFLASRLCCAVTQPKRTPVETPGKQERLLLLALIAYVNHPSADERNKRASSEKAIDWASEKKGNKTAAHILLIKAIF